jgi:L-lactate dehydrogenase (cytochrome)
LTSIQIDPRTITQAQKATAEDKAAAAHAAAVPKTTWGKPPLEHMLNLFDFEAVAKAVMKKESWDYYASAADDEVCGRPASVW